MVPSKVITKDKNTFSVSVKVTITAPIDVILICFYVTTWRTRSSHPEGFCKKGDFKNFAGNTKTSVPESFFDKDSGRGSVTLLQRDFSIGVLL